MASRVAHGHVLPPEVIEQVVARTDGVPLFVEELTKMVLESGLIEEREEHYELTGPLPPLAIPATLHDSLMARLDRLAMVKGLAQLGATLGREFAYELLRAVSPWDEDTLRRGLHQLVQAEFLYQRGLPPQATYVFKHVLIQDAAYQSLLKSTRQQYHQRIAQVLAAQFPDIVETQPELLAQHCTEAGMAAQAILYWQRAGQQAMQRSANLEAINHLTKGLELLKTLPETPERARQELDVQTALGPALMAAKGYAAPEVEHTYARARDLCRQMGEPPQLFPVLWGLYTLYVIRAELRMAHELGEQLFSLAQRQQDPALLIQAHRALGNSLVWLGEFAPALAHLQQEMTLYDPQQHRSLTFLYGEDLGVVCLSYTALVQWLLGYPDQALKSTHEALSLARELSHPFSLARALFWAARLHQMRREAQAVHERVEALMALAREQGFSYRLTQGTILRGWALIEQGQGDLGIAQMRQSLANHRAGGAELARTYWLAMLAEAYGKGGQAREGLHVLEEALVVVEKTGERYWEAELHRLKGQLLLKCQVRNLQSGVRQPSEAEACFWRALTIAHRQGAKSLELRAAMNLTRLWQQQGKHDEARELLEEVYNWFTEGFDTADLQEAKELLEELS
jgi:predicted ATPase